MRDCTRVIVQGIGQMGSRIARLVLEKPALELADTCARRANREGVDIGQAIGLNRELRLPVYTDLSVAVKTARPQVAIQADYFTTNCAAQPQLPIDFVWNVSRHSPKSCKHSL